MFQELVSASNGQIWMRVGKVVCLARVGERGEKQLAELYAHDAFILTLAATADGRYIASGDKQGELLVYGMEERRLVGVMRAWGRKIEGLAWDSDGEVLVSLSSDPTDPTSPFTEHWRLPGERREVLLTWEWPAEDLWAPDYRAFAWIEDGVPMVHYPAEGHTVALQWQQPTDYQATMLAWSPDSRFLAVVDKRFLAIWEARTGLLLTCRWHGTQVRGIAWPDPLTLVTSETGGGQVLQQWHLPASVFQAPPTLPEFPVPKGGPVPILTDDERRWQAKQEAKAGEPEDEESEEEAPVPLGIPLRLQGLIEEAREAGSRWAEESPEEAADLGVVHREGQEAPHRRYPAISGGREEAIYEEAWMVGALTARNTSRET